MLRKLKKEAASGKATKAKGTVTKPKIQAE